MNSPQDSQQAVLFHWQWNKKLLVFALIFLPVTVSLGVWQLQRAEQKRDILAAQKERIEAEPVAFETLIGETENQFRNVTAIGDFDDDKVLLLDNRVRHGRAGYEILNLLKPNVTGLGHWLLVNRGWLPGGYDRSVLPEVPAPSRGLVSGYLYRSPGKSIVLKEEVWTKGDWPLVIQAIDFEKLSKHLGHEIFPYVLRVVDDAYIDNETMFSSGAIKQGLVLETGWAVVNVMPEKHIGYAVQWFLMALALLVLMLFANSNLAELLGRNRQDSQ